MELKPELLATVQHLIAQAQNRAVRTVDAERVRPYWHLGQVLVKEQQQGTDHAAYGTGLVRGLATKLQPQFGSGYSERQLQQQLTLDYLEQEGYWCVYGHH